VVCAVKLGRVFQEFVPPPKRSGRTDHNNPRPSCGKKRFHPAFLAILELEIVTGKLCPATVLTQIAIQRILRNPLSDFPIDIAIDRPCPVSIIYHTDSIPANMGRRLGKLRRAGKLAFLEFRT
jgi:hypothetical protein